MKKKFVKAMLFGALSLSVSTSLVSCSDYDDDIQNLQQQIDEVKASVADLQAKVNSGNWVKSVESVNGEFKLTFNDGQVYTIVNGTDGADGADGHSPKLTVENGFWCIDGVQTEWPSQGEKGDKGDKGDKGSQGLEGDKGDNGLSPYVGEDGYWYWYSDADERWIQGDAANVSMYIVKNEGKPSWTLHVYNAEKAVWEDAILPTADAISDLKVVGIADGKVTAEGDEIELYYGTCDDPVVFGPEGEQKTYGGAGKILFSNSAKIHAQVNPADVDATEYTISLQNTKGESVYQVTKIEKNMSDNPLSRASENQGLYDLTISFKDDETVPSLGVAYALKTENAFGKTILSAYDAKIKPVAQEKTLGSLSTLDKQFGQDFVLSELVKEAGGSNLDYVADYYFTSEATGVTIKKNEEGQYVINSSKGQTVNVTVHYLTVMGNKKEATLTINFSELVTVGEISWFVNNTSDVVRATFDAKAQDLLNNGTVMDAYVIRSVTDGKDYQEGSISLTVEKVNDEWMLKATFDETTIAATAEYNAALTFKKNGAVIATAVATIKVGMNPDDLFVYFPLEAYFNGNEAVAYGTPNGMNIDYNLFKLFGKNVNGQYAEIHSAEQAYFDFEEGTYDWLQLATKGAISVPLAEAYKKEAFTVNYYPFGNRYLDPITKTFNLTIKSEIKESTVKGTVNDKFISLSNKSFALSANDFVWKDAYNKNINWGSDTRVVSMTLKLNEKAVPYLELTGNGELKDANGLNNVTISLKNDITVISNDVLDSGLVLEVVDEWGQTSTVTVSVPIRK